MISLFLNLIHCFVNRFGYSVRLKKCFDKIICLLLISSYKHFPAPSIQISIVSPRTLSSVIRYYDGIWHVRFRPVIGRHSRSSAIIIRSGTVEFGSDSARRLLTAQSAAFAHHICPSLTLTLSVTTATPVNVFTIGWTSFGNSLASRNSTLVHQKPLAIAARSLNTHRKTLWKLTSKSIFLKVKTCSFCW